MKKGLVLFVLILVSLISIVSAKLTISEPKEIYNLGDKLYVSVNGVKGSDSGNLNINLECGGNIANLLKISARAFSPAGGQSYALPYKILTKEDLEIESLEQIIGQCQIFATIGVEQASTKNFQISNQILIEAKADKSNYDPGEAITLNLKATKANGDLVDGFVEASGAYDFSKEIKKGLITETFSMPEDTDAGDYVLNLFVYDSNEGIGILNEGNSTVSFKINQVASNVKTSLSALEITPEQNLTISADIYDQSGKEMAGDVSVLLISPNGEETPATVKSGEFISFDFPLNAAPGNWKIFSSFLDITKESEFKMLEFQKVEFEFQNSILIVKNIGNVRYNKIIKVDIGGSIQEVPVDINVGGVKSFNLRAPDGEYSVVVGDDKTSASTSVMLTGKAISIKDLENVGIFKGYSIVWVFLIIVLTGIGVVLLFRYNKRTIKLSDKMKKFGNVSGKFNSVREKIGHSMPEKYSANLSNTLPFTNKSPSSQNLDGNEDEKHGMIDLTHSKVGKAESSLVLAGEKNSCAVIALHIKNYGSLSNDAKKRLAEIVSNVKKNHGLVDWKGEYVFIVFSPLATRTFKNELLASKAGFEIFEKIILQNKKFKDKIDFNIGINAGDLITSKEAGKLKYTSLGNTVALAKRIADSSSKKVLISDAIRDKLRRDLKTEKVGNIGKFNIYEVFKVVNREANAEKLKEILKRMEHS